MSELREKLAALAHDQWAGWMVYLFSKAEINPDGTWTMPAEFVHRWQRQMNTPYSKLWTSEQDSDRAEAEKFLAVMREYLPASIEPVPATDESAAADDAIRAAFEPLCAAVKRDDDHWVLWPATEQLEAQLVSVAHQFPDETFVVRSMHGTRLNYKLNESADDDC